MTARLAESPPEFQERLRRIHRELGIPEDFPETTRLPLWVEPPELVDAGLDYYQRPQKMTAATSYAWRAMDHAARADDVTLYLISAYRGIEYQRDLIRKKLEQGRQLAEILRVTAAPGFSEHHTGRALDLGTDDCTDLREHFEETSAFQWLESRARDFGFVLSYPRDNPLGICYEPWHWCFKV
jgi:D-alanyl-D-alanine carboxypeptidase